MRDSWWIHVPWEVLGSLVAAMLLFAPHLNLLSTWGNNIHILTRYDIQGLSFHCWEEKHLKNTPKLISSISRWRFLIIYNHIWCGENCVWKISTDTDFTLVKSKVRRWRWNSRWLCLPRQNSCSWHMMRLSGTLNVKLNQNCIMHCMCKCVFSQNARSFREDDLRFLTRANVSFVFDIRGLMILTASTLELDILTRNGTIVIPMILYKI